LRLQTPKFFWVLKQICGKLKRTNPGTILKDIAISFGKILFPKIFASHGQFLHEITVDKWGIRGDVCERVFS